VKIDYLEDFLTPWGRVEVNEGAFAEPVPAPLQLTVESAAVAELYTGVEARKAQCLGLFRSEDLAVFLPVWEAEESEHGRVLARLASIDPTRRELTKTMSRGERIRDKVMWFVFPIARILPGADLTYCAMGAIGEAHTIALYHEVASRVQNEHQRQLFLNLAKQEGRHLRFYKAACKVRAENAGRSTLAMARFSLRRFWVPVGVDSLGVRRWLEAFGPLLQEPDFFKKVLKADELLDDLPGLSNLTLFRSFLYKIAHNNSSGVLTNLVQAMGPQARRLTQA
jgi:rubrerythrin